MRVVLCTVPRIELGRAIARALVEERLAACAQVDTAAIESTYRWEGAVASDREYRLLIKTADRCLPALRARILELHEASVPQIVDFEADANADYARWLDESCG